MEQEEKKSVRRHELGQSEEELEDETSAGCVIYGRKTVHCHKPVFGHPVCLHPGQN